MQRNILFVHYGDNWIRGTEEALLRLLERLEPEFRPVVLCNQALLADRVSQIPGAHAELMRIPEIMIDAGRWRLEVLAWRRAIGRIHATALRCGAHLLFASNGRPCQSGLYAARRARIPIVVHVHSDYSLRHLALYRVHRASRVVFGSEAVRAAAEDRIRFRGECHVVRYGVDTERFRPAERREEDLRARLGIPPGSPVVGQVSSLIPRKGADVLLEAFARTRCEHPDAHLVVVGSGPGEDALREQVRRLGLGGAVHLPGPVDGADDYYRHIFDIHVLASRLEALPLSLVEAAACALPQVATRVGGVGEIVLDRRTGFLVEPDDPVALAGRLSMLLAAPGLRSKLGENARRHVLAGFTIESYARGVQEVMCGAIGSGAARAA